MLPPDITTHVLVAYGIGSLCGALGGWRFARSATFTAFRARRASRTQQASVFLVLLVVWGLVATATSAFYVVYLSPRGVLAVNGWDDLVTAGSLGAVLGALGALVAHPSTHRRWLVRTVWLTVWGLALWRTEMEQGSVVSRTSPRGLVEDGVVLQTTPVTCGAAVIATLARLAGTDTGATERQAARLAHTTPSGTPLRGAMSALAAWHLAPEYRRHMTLEALAADGRVAYATTILRLPGATIAHAVGILAVDTVRRTVEVADPLSGRRVRPWAEFEIDWRHEAILVTARQGGAHGTGPTRSGPPRAPRPR